ncbi:glucosaminidase domain-containing protein [Shewanella sp. GXUN23E]|uniref:glucosaminidase domain-containing protein n=1 Tax=Shewanella sp. GXUN23E TaxID=3422498 RepID=UPI003D7CE706
MKTGRFGNLILAFALVVVTIYGLRVVLLPVGGEGTAEVDMLVVNPLPEDTAQLPDFSAIADVREKKQAFFDFLRPKIREQNALIAKERAFVKTVYGQLKQGHKLTDAESYQIGELAEKYQLTIRVIDTDTLERLLRRVDVVPENMVLIQAANETGWGSSRFAKEGLNFFGQWCFKKGCGLVPLSRNDGMSHEVARFDSVDASVRSYLNNLNTNGAYQLFRAIRADIRSEGGRPKAKDLVYGLVNYSERQEEYIEELLQMLQHNSELLTTKNS